MMSLELFSPNISSLTLAPGCDKRVVTDNGYCYWLPNWLILLDTVSHRNIKGEEEVKVGSGTVELLCCQLSQSFLCTSDDLCLVN